MNTETKLNNKAVLDWEGTDTTREVHPDKTRAIGERAVMGGGGVSAHMHKQLQVSTPIPETSLTVCYTLCLKEKVTPSLSTAITVKETIMYLCRFCCQLSKATGFNA